MPWRSSGFRRRARLATACAAAIFALVASGGLRAATPSPVARAISAGGDHTCALLAGGSVECWGDNADGQLGVGTSSGPMACNGDPCARTPVAVRAITTATAISAGGDHTCALLADGSVECWGDNADGQLGVGTSSGPMACSGDPCSTTPVPVRGIAHATAISAGGTQTCALLVGGSLECWGYNGYGQLGVGTSSGPHTCRDGAPCATTPVAVRGIVNATAITAGNDHTCALLATGAVDCWGYNFSAELGVGTSSGPHFCTAGQWCSTTPVAVLGVANATAVVAGGDHTCALLAAGRVDCWGYNSYGQLGDGVSGGPETCEFGVVRCAKTPVAASGTTSPTALAAGGDHTCALGAGGRVTCWGANSFGELGDGTRNGPGACNGYPCSATPVAVSRLTGATAISGGGDHTCALLSGGGVDCWGEGAYGELGDGRIAERDVPATVSGLAGA
jgi:alpha-tubulin suppressor-like RCC1 family protein